MRSAAAALRGGGKLLLVDIHPLFTMVASTDPLRLDFPYANDGPRALRRAGLVRGRGPRRGRHRDGRVRPLARRGRQRRAGAPACKIQRLDEHLDADFDPRGDLLAREDDGRYRLRVDGELLPVLFALVAAKP